MSKSPDAFRTISEVADWLDRPAHVLRFWESKFTQVKPIKRAGGRRYYRPQDMLLLGGIKKLLHDDGMTIKGVQKLLRDNGIAHVADMSQPLEHDLDAEILDTGHAQEPPVAATQDRPEGATLLSFPNPDLAAEADLAPAPVEQVEHEMTAAAKASDARSVDVAPVDEPPSFFTAFDAPAPTSQAADTAPDSAPPKPEIVQVDLDFQSQAGPGILSRMATHRTALAKADPARLQEMRGALSALLARLKDTRPPG
ncbi:MerR family transcriptional regulator [Thalassovita sp.]|uniref:MerR family transcriptional regulator n=1 Tax=Thalassovita sp. TaxID=1979401 RepID=UPI0029DE7AD5|nr:MerR family transcriptional regulator [Thalassovita sp.]